jgi:large subunit ribosomal protein L17
MRHQVRGRKLGRTSSHRKATLQALANGLIRSERITTTLPKAKELRKFVEPLITRSKEDNLLNRRMVFAALRDKDVVKKIFEEVGPKVADRPGGYTRIVKAGFRPGDGSPVAIIELVDYNDSQPETAGKKKKRTRRGSGKAKETADTATAKAPARDKAAEKPAAPEVKGDVETEETVKGAAGAEVAETAESTPAETGSETSAEVETEAVASADAEPAVEVSKAEVEEAATETPKAEAGTEKAQADTEAEADAKTEAEAKKADAKGAEAEAADETKAEAETGTADDSGEESADEGEKKEEK